MIIKPDAERPIFIQIARQIEDSVFTGIFPEETQIPSTNEMSAIFGINPHTVLKGMNILVEEGIIYKKRGLGMFVKSGATEKIRAKREKRFFEKYVEPLVNEAAKLKMSESDVISLIERSYKDAGNTD